MNKKLAHNSHIQINQFRREQMGSLLSLASLSMSGTRAKHINTNAKRDDFNVEVLERNSLYLGKVHSDLIKRNSTSFDSLTVSDITPYLQASLSPYEGFLGVIDDTASMTAVRLTLRKPNGHKVYAWHYSISLQDSDLYPSWHEFSSLRAFAVHIALGRVVRGDITRAAFTMFCSDVISTMRFLDLNDRFISYSREKM